MIDSNFKNCFLKLFVNFKQLLQNSSINLSVMRAKISSFVLNIFHLPSFHRHIIHNEISSNNFLFKLIIYSD